MAVSKIQQKDLIASLGRGLAIIEAFDDENPRMTASEVAARSGMNRTAARRYLLSLCHFGYASHDGQAFWLNPRVLRLGQSYLLSARLPRLASPYLERLAEQTDATASLAVLDGHDVIYLTRSGTGQVPNAAFQVGARVPAHVVSPGIAILAAMSPADFDAWLDGHDFVTFTRHTMADAKALRAEVARARADGFAVLSEQLELGFHGLAVALRNRRGECVGALSLTASTRRLASDTLLDVGLAPLRVAESGLRGLM